QSSYYWVDVVFTTAIVDGTNPAVTGVSPGDGYVEVGTGTAVTANFSEALDPASVTAANFELRQGGSPVAAAITYDAVASTARLTPLEPLEPLTAYVATLRGGSSGVRDPAGNPLVSDYVWSFTTG